MSSTIQTSARVGHCTCGAPVADHFDRHNRKLSCEQARRRWQARLDNERSHRDLLVSVIGTIVCARTGRHISTTPAVESLSEREQQDVTLLAQLVLAYLDPDRRRATREHAIARGLDEFRQWLGQRELQPKTRAQMRVVLEGVLNAFTFGLQGLDTITDGDIERARERVALPAFTFHNGDRTLTFNATDEDEARLMLERALAGVEDPDPWQLRARRIESAQASEGEMRVAVCGASISDVLAALVATGAYAREEHPGYVVIPHAHNAAHWQFGTVNGTWDGDLVTADGGHIRSKSTGIEASCTDAALIADGIRSVVSQFAEVQ